MIHRPFTSDDTAASFFLRSSITCGPVRPTDASSCTTDMTLEQPGEGMALPIENRCPAVARTTLSGAN
uniref:Uncharacterized protein n=1 Tax=Arundo donax TaxID=35708 RepID=A0A0A8Y2B2_ARUDO